MDYRYKTNKIVCFSFRCSQNYRKTKLQKKGKTKPLKSKNKILTEIQT